MLPPVVPLRHRMVAHTLHTSDGSRNRGVAGNPLPITGGFLSRSFARLALPGLDAVCSPRDSPTKLSRLGMIGMKRATVSTLLWTLALSLLSAPVGSFGLPGQPPSDLLEQRMQELAPGAIDCGRVDIRADPEKATNCALDAFKNKKSFRVRYDLQGIDSNVAVGWVGTAAGTVTAISFDGDPMGRGGTSASRQRVDEHACPQPLKLFRSPEGRLNCFPPHQNAKRDVMSPTFEPY